MPVVENRHIVSLRCFSEEAVRQVILDLGGVTEDYHWLREGGHDLLAIGYLDVRWPMDVADYAQTQGYADEDEAITTIRRAQRNMGIL